MKIKIYHNWFSTRIVDIVRHDALTLGRRIFFRKGTLKPSLLAHELCHVYQFHKGKLKFLVKYLYYLIVRGYKDNPYEIQARAEGSKYQQIALEMINTYAEEKKNKGKKF